MTVQQIELYYYLARRDQIEGQRFAATETAKALFQILALNRPG